MDGTTEERKMDGTTEERKMDGHGTTEERKMDGHGTIEMRDLPESDREKLFWLLLQWKAKQALSTGHRWSFRDQVIRRINMICSLPY